MKSRTLKSVYLDNREYTLCLSHHRDSIYGHWRCPDCNEFSSATVPCSTPEEAANSARAELVKHHEKAHLCGQA